MAIRLEDKDGRISSLAKLFFHELSKKGAFYFIIFTNQSSLSWFYDLGEMIFLFIVLLGNNPVYNLLPDILGRLSNQNLNNEAFCNIMHFLINSIKKVMNNVILLTFKISLHSDSRHSRQILIFLKEKNHAV